MNRTLALTSALFLLACSDTSDQIGNVPPDPGKNRDQGIAVFSGDYKSTVISLVDPSQSALAQDDCINSGAVTPILSMAISGDVTMPSQPQPNHALVIIDRKNSALVWLDPNSCMATKQMSVSTGFNANPHDLVGLSPEKAYVTRYKTNPMPSGMPNANDQGQDLLIINPGAQSVLGRIDLKPYATAANVEARPDRAILANGKVYVALNQISTDLKTIGPGRVVIVDPKTDAVTGTIDTPGVNNCNLLDYLESSKTLFINCRGDYNVPATQPSQSALLLYDISGPTPVLKKAIPASATGNRALGTSLAAVSDQLALVATSGDRTGPVPDQLWSVNLMSGTATKIVDGDASLVFGVVYGTGMVYSPVEKRVFLGNGSMQNPSMLVYDVSNPSNVVLTGSFATNPKSGLRPLAVARY